MFSCSVANQNVFVKLQLEKTKFVLLILCLISDVIWVIICVDEGGLLAVTQQLSHLGQEFSPSQHPTGSPAVNPFGPLPTTPNGNSPQLNYTVPHNSPCSLLGSPIRRTLFNNSNDVSMDNNIMDHKSMNIRDH